MTFAIDELLIQIDKHITEFSGQSLCDSDKVSDAFLDLRSSIQRLRPTDSSGDNESNASPVN